MDTGKMLVAGLGIVILISFIAMIVKKAGKVVILCSLGLIMIIGPVACAALTKQ